MAFVAWVPPLQPCTPVGSWPPELHEGRGVREHGRMEHRPQELGAVTMAAGVRRAPCGAGGNESGGILLRHVRLRVRAFGSTGGGARQGVRAHRVCGSGISAR
jgi:hypothetical protein